MVWGDLFFNAIAFLCGFIFYYKWGILKKTFGKMELDMH